MFRRRGRKDDETELGTDDGTGTGAEPEPDDVAADPVGDDAPAGPTPKSERPDGPYDVAEVDLDDEETQAGRIDLGGLLIRGADGMSLQLQVEEGTERVQAALVILEDSAVQLLAVAAPRSEGLWGETMDEMSADAHQRGASVERGEGPFGTELRVLLPVELPDGEQGVQPSRVVGIDGPRWMLRATFLGRAAIEEPAFGALAQVVRDVVVVRGDAPMAPGDGIELRVPEELVAVAEDDDDDPDAPGGEQRRPTLEDLDPGPTVTEIR